MHICWIDDPSSEPYPEVDHKDWSCWDWGACLAFCLYQAAWLGARP